MKPPGISCPSLQSGCDVLMPLAHPEGCEAGVAQQYLPKTALTQNCPSHSGLAQGFFQMKGTTKTQSAALVSGVWVPGTQGWHRAHPPCCAAASHSIVSPLKAPATLASCIPSQQSPGSWPALKLCHLITHPTGQVDPAWPCMELLTQALTGAEVKLLTNVGSSDGESKHQLASQTGIRKFSQQTTN